MARRVCEFLTNSCRHMHSGQIASRSIGSRAGSGPRQLQDAAQYTHTRGRASQRRQRAQCSLHSAPGRSESQQPRSSAQKLRHVACSARLGGDCASGSRDRHSCGAACRRGAPRSCLRQGDEKSPCWAISSSAFSEAQPAERSMVLDSLDEDALPGRMAYIDAGPAEIAMAEMGKYMDAVVKVYCVHTEPNYSLPWQRKRQFASTSTGFLIDAGGDGQRWLLTNAHSVEYHSQVKVKRRGDDRKFLARVLAVGTECDIALMTVEDDAFWEGVDPLTFGTLPHLQDAVAVVGYPVGGETISVTSGVVSRIEVTSYAHSSTELLGVQIDAAINSGNSGGPVFNQAGQCVGIAFQSLSGGDAENIGYVIPTPVVDHFLSDYQRNGRFTGFPALGIRWQRMESDSLRESFQMAAGQKGVMVRAVSPIADTSNHLQPDDVLMRFDGVQIASDGTVPFRSGERIAFGYLVSRKFTGEQARLEVLRRGQLHTVHARLDAPQALVPLHLAGADPSFLIIAGLVFTPCCEPYLASEYGADYPSDSPTKLLERLLYGFKRKPGEQVVLLSQVLACDATLGYEDHFNVEVLKFNGVPVENLRHLAQLAATCTHHFMRFDLEYQEVLVLETKAANEATADILQAHSIPAAVSKDLADLLAAPPHQPDGILEAS